MLRTAALPESSASPWLASQAFPKAVRIERTRSPVREKTQGELDQCRSRSAFAMPRMAATSVSPTAKGPTFLNKGITLCHIQPGLKTGSSFWITFAGAVYRNCAFDARTIYRGLVIK
jgi:hypothetical protein